ncbi:hypothetical protein [Salicola sp. Rm-C-2C1-2]|uniref:hypothetical protein n=1 Tax=Salicola sp. Rm-C-2C1-2 TaxID=3141321 RepID=UPI0032E41E19
MRMSSARVSPYAFPVRRILTALISVLPLLLLGCGDTSKSPEDPRILGLPPQVAYLGADYNYNFGALGGDDPLNYSLVNNPSWLALEATTNKARKGIVLRGVPGISGGREGEADLGQYDNIRIATNDGNLIGDSEFSVDVRHNPLKIVDATLVEGEAYEPDVNDGSDEVCEIPDRQVTPEAAVEHGSLVVGNGDGYSPGGRAYPSRRALIRVDLEQPSVEPLAVRFRVGGQDTATGENCEGDSDLPCEYQEGNQSRAIYGEDLVLDGNARYGSGFPEPPEYVEYIKEEATGATGLLNFEAGQTTCFIPVWVHDDNLAEDEEFFDVELEQVTKGIASLDDNGAVRSRSIAIEDDTPTADFEAESIVVSENRKREVTATLSRANDTGEALYAAVEVAEVDDDSSWEADLCPDEGSSGSECVTVGNGSNDASLTVEFDKGGDATTFYVQASTDTDAPLKEEVMRELQFDQSFQYGREFAAATTDSILETHINEWTDDVTQNELGFPVNSLVAGELGEAYVTGVDDSGGIRLQSINRLGSTDSSDKDVVALGELKGKGNADWSSLADNSTLQLAFAGENSGTSGAPAVTRYLGLAYPTQMKQGDVKLFRSTISTEDGSISRSPSADELVWELVPDPESDWLQRALAVTTEGTVYAGALGDASLRMTRIDTAENSNGDSVAEQSWTESLEATGATLSGLFTPGTAGIVALGSDGGAVDPGSNIGGEDFYLFSRDTEGAVNERVQFGTQGEDRATLSDADGSRFWLAGNDGGPYEADDSGGFKEEADGSAGAFLLIVNSNGDLQAAVHPQDLEDHNAQVGNIQALVVSGDNAFIAGQTKDDSVYLMGVRYTGSQADDEAAIEQRWSATIGDADSVVALDNYRDRKLYLVMDGGSGQRIRLYDQVGNPLTQ